MTRTAEVQARPSPALERVWSLLDGMSEPAVRAHDLGPLAAHRWRETGRAVPPDFSRIARAAAVSRRLANMVLERATSAYQGPLLVFKGPEIAARYPPGTRFFSDVDLLTDDAPAAQSALLAAGFIEVDDPDDIYAAELHHLKPIHLPGIPLNLEIHKRPKWPPVLPPPDVKEIVNASVPSRTSVAGLLAPAPAHHALIAVGHAWAHMPLRAIRNLLDTELVAAEAEPAEIELVATRWGVERLWRTDAAIRAWLFRDGPEPVPVRLWGRHLRTAREPNVLSGHAERWLAPFWMLPPRSAARASARAVAGDFAPQGDESWGAKARRIGRTTMHAFKTHSEHGWDPREGPAPRRRVADRPPR